MSAAPEPKAGAAAPLAPAAADVNSTAVLVEALPYIRGSGARPSS